eukprot:CAMPEP_0178895538 /NCGR_PEP_ID=MMETSP0786-20121207/648_1 /TAXON_ID=186022 /ORGANISM="Thalassionema frauenfeldii, Strain CCMP 1798" /LENGTH=368 /DNA_ID=CAMNT_0020565791 /DNA_START=25 /DNA_END=1131 /DNA_ORIENTATION=-
MNTGSPRLSLDDISSRNAQLLISLAKLDDMISEEERSIQKNEFDLSKAKQLIDRIGEMKGQRSDEASSRDDFSSQRNSADQQRKCEMPTRKPVRDASKQETETDSLLRAIMLSDDKVSLRDINSQELIEAVDCLTKGSKRFVIPELWTKTENLLTNAIIAKQSHSVAALRLCKTYPALAESNVEYLAFEILRREPKLLLHNDSLRVLNPPMIHDILKRNYKIGADKYTLFQMLKAWLAADKTRHGNSSELRQLLSPDSLSSDSKLTTIEESSPRTKDIFFSAVAPPRSKRNIPTPYKPKNLNPSKHDLVETTGHNGENFWPDQELENSFATPDDDFWSCDDRMLQSCEDALASILARKIEGRRPAKAA